MSITFISAKEKKQSLLWGIGILVALFLLVTLGAIFLPGFLNPPVNNQPPAPLPGAAAGSPFTINFSILDSDKVKNLQPFMAPQTTFTYTVTDKNGKSTTGTILAPTKQEAQALLENSGFTVTSIGEMNIGKANPFIPY